MRPLVDERGLSERILREGRFLAPLALVSFSFLIAGSDAWILASGSAILLAAYIMEGWDGRILLLYGIGMLALCIPFIFIAPGHADWAAVQGYWLLAAGAAAMALGLKDPVSPRGNPPGRMHTRSP